MDDEGQREEASEVAISGADTDAPTTEAASHSPDEQTPPGDENGVQRSAEGDSEESDLLAQGAAVEPAEEVVPRPDLREGIWILAPIGNTHNFVNADAEWQQIHATVEAFRNEQPGNHSPAALRALIGNEDVNILSALIRQWIQTRRRLQSLDSWETRLAEFGPRSRQAFHELG